MPRSRDRGIFYWAVIGRCMAFPVSGVHIRFCGNGDWRFRSYSESLFQTPKRNQKALPLHSVPRCGSACPHSGIAPGARRHRPSMAGGGYRGILAAVPLRNACVRPLGKGQQIKIKIKSRSNGNGKINSFASKPAPTVGLGTSLSDCSAARPPSPAGQLPHWLGVRLLILTTHQAER